MAKVSKEADRIWARFEVRDLDWGWERDTVIKFFLKDWEQGTFTDFYIALVGLDLWNQKGNFYVFTQSARNAIKIPVKKVLVNTNAAGSVMVDQELLEREVKAALLGRLVNGDLTLA